MSRRYALILAAGKGTRFKSDKPKVLHLVCGKPMITYLLDRMPDLGVERTIVVVGEGDDQVRGALAEYNVDFVTQTRQLGTGHAVMSAASALQGLQGSLIVLYGDTPLIGSEALSNLFEAREANDADEALITVEMMKPTGYGRIIRDSNNRIADIIEEKEASEQVKRIREINAGFVCFDIESLLASIHQLSSANSAGEYYLTDMVKILYREGKRIETVQVEEANEIFGINDRAQLADAEDQLRRQINREWMLRGVTLLDPASVHISFDSRIGVETVIYPGVIIEGKTSIGKRCTIRAYSHLVNADLKDNVLVDHCTVVRDRAIEAGNTVGPFAHLKANSSIGAGKGASVPEGSKTTEKAPPKAVASGSRGGTTKKG